MPELLRCRACGFVTDEVSLGNVCPACGVPRTSFEPFTDRVSAARRRWLGHHFHPVTVHFPQACAVFLFFVICVGYFSSGFPVISERFLDTAWVMSFFFPFAVLGGFVTGIVDGRIRFKRLDAPYLKLKIATGVLLLVVSSAESVVIHTDGIQPDTIWIILSLNLIAVGCVTILGKYGERLVCAAMGGK